MSAARMTTVRLADLLPEPQYVELPDAFDRDGQRIPGRTLRVRDIDPIAQQLGESAQTALADGRFTEADADLVRLARRLLPDATAEEIGSLGGGGILGLYQIAARRVDAYLEHLRALGKSEAARPTPPTETPSDGSASSSLG